MYILAGLVIGIVFMSGCINNTSSSLETGTPTPQIVYVTVLVTQIPSTDRPQEPIIGVWRYSDTTGHDSRYRFNADGWFDNSYVYMPTKNVIVLAGTWKAQGNNTYSLHYPASRTSETIIYDPVQNAIYDQNLPTYVFIPYQGDVATPIEGPSKPP